MLRIKGYISAERFDLIQKAYDGYRARLEAYPEFNLALCRMDQGLDLIMSTRLKTCLGRALLNRKDFSCWIELHARAFETLSDEKLIETFGHELAHTVCQLVYKHKVNHGSEWVRVMRIFGLEATRCHNEIAAIKPYKPQVKRHAYNCGCAGKVFNLTTIKHNRHMRGVSKFQCRVCKIALTPAE